MNQIKPGDLVRILRITPKSGMIVTGLDPLIGKVFEAGQTDPINNRVLIDVNTRFEAKFSNLQYSYRMTYWLFDPADLELVFSK